MRRSHYGVVARGQCSMWVHWQQVIIDYWAGRFAIRALLAILLLEVLNSFFLWLLICLLNRINYFQFPNNLTVQQKLNPNKL